MADRICTNPDCHWEPWFRCRVTYAPPPIGYVTCPLDHGLAGEIEAIIQMTVAHGRGYEVAALEITRLVTSRLVD